MQNIWLLNSEDFDHKGTAWNVWMEANLDEVNTLNDVLQQAQKHFNKLPLINSPSPFGTQRAVLCMYNETGSVFAINPPLHQVSDQLLPFIKK